MAFPACTSLDTRCSLGGVGNHQSARLAGPSALSCNNRVQKRRSSLVMRAEKDGFEDLKKKLIDSGKAPIGNELPGEGKAKEEDKTVAIVTGAVSIGIGVLYLAGVAFLNGSRGNNLEPPPPEAFGWLGQTILQQLQ